MCSGEITTKVARRCDWKLVRNWTAARVSPQRLGKWGGCEYEEHVFVLGKRRYGAEDSAVTPRVLLLRRALEEGSRLTAAATGTLKAECWLAFREHAKGNKITSEPQCSPDSPR